MKRKISLLIAVGIILLQLSADPFAIWASENNGNNANAAETATKYKVILDVQGNLTITEELEAGELIKTNPAIPVVEGYAFWGWYDQPNGQGVRWTPTGLPMPGHDLHLYAYFTIKTYTATLISEERTATQPVVYQNKINEPTKPVKDGYTFIGWYDAETGGKKWDFANDLMPGKNITLYARFASKTYPMTFDNGGVTTTETVDYDGLAEEPTTPTKAGYTFDGWYDAETGGKKWDFAQDKMPANPVTLYARFTMNNYTATFNNDGTTTTETVDYQEALTEPTEPTKDGYTFDGWYDAQTGGTKWNFATNKMPANNITLYARYSVKSYTATFDKEGTTTTQTANYDSLLTEPAAPTKDGYTFDGWYDAETGGTKWNFATNKMPAKNVTLYARFTVKSYTATFDKDGTTTTQTVNYDSLIQEPTAPTKDGYTFTGWYDAETGGNKWDFAANKMPAKNVTLYARFSTNAYTATFDKEGTTTTQAVDYDSLLTEPTAPTKDGYTFDGWYDAETGGSKWDFVANKMPAKDVTLYARFTVKSYTVTLNGEAVTTQTVDYLGLLQEPTAPIKAGYTFDGWYDAETGGNKWDFATNKMPANDLALYARFTKNPVAPVDPVDPVNPIQPSDPADPAHQDDPIDNILPATEKTNITAAVKPANDPVKITKQSKKLPKTGDQENILYLLIGLLLIAGTFGYIKKMSHK
ncbi:LPXTG cell wall anchor domain-containing protein [Listeria monocytogenes]|nr:LPXTG cell wall anchor domain-containing protein [Listeria monocytogenes]